MSVPAWKSAKVVDNQPAGAAYLGEHNGWWYYVCGATIFARRAI